MPEANRKKRKRRKRAALVGVVVVGGGIIWALARWQEGERKQVVSATTLRSLGIAMQLYAQDWDGRPAPPAIPRPDGTWQTWAHCLRAYISPKNLDSPINPLTKTLRHPTDGYPITAAFALNRRFWDTFGKGAYPLENLDLPERTALFVEAGPMWRHPTRPTRNREDRANFALMDYGDVTDRVQGYCPYPSPHDGRLALVAADGHAEFVKVEYYTDEEGLHDKLYGRIGGGIYNWNGGLPPGETDKPPRE